MDRRSFLKHSLAAGGALALSRGTVQAAPKSAFDAPARKFASDMIELGPDKLRLSRLAMGTGTSAWFGSCSSRSCA